MKYPFDKNVVFAYSILNSIVTNVMYRIIRHDKFQDLVLNLDKLTNDKQYYTTKDNLNAKQGNGVIALSLPLGNWKVVRQLLSAYHQSFKVEHVLINNVNDVPIKSLISLVKILRSIYYGISIGMFGCYYDAYNEVNPTSNYLINNCKSTEIH